MERGGGRGKEEISTAKYFSFLSASTNYNGFEKKLFSIIRQIRADVSKFSSEKYTTGMIYIRYILLRIPRIDGSIVNETVINSPLGRPKRTKQITTRNRRQSLNYLEDGKRKKEKHVLSIFSTSRIGT